jgi:hypothetical protein
MLESARGEYERMGASSVSDPAMAIMKFGAALERSIDASVRALAPAGDPAVEIAWAEGNLMHLSVTLRSGRVIRGVGVAKLEAIADAEARDA